jgi:hypothetical protein
MSKTAGGITIVSVGAALLLWKDIVPILEWLAPIFGRESIQHIATALLIATLTLPTPWALPKKLAPFWTGTVSAAFAWGVAVTIYATLAWPLTRTDVVYAFGSGVGAVVANLFFTALYLHLRPLAIPESLKK